MTKACTTHHHACDCREAEWAQKMATQQARIEELEEALTTIRYCEPFLGTGDYPTASEIAAEALRQEADHE